MVPLRIKKYRQRKSKRLGSDGEVELTSFENPMQEKGVKNEIKKKKRNSRMKKVRKKLSIGARVRRTSHVGGGSMSGEVKTVLEVGTADSIHVHAETGRRYSYNAETSETKWLDEGEEQGGATQSETKNHSTKRQSFRKIVGDDNAVFFQNIETEETVWEVPKNGDLVEL